MNALILVFFLISSQKGWWPIHAFGRSYLYFRTTFIYDDNIFRYSDRDLKDFKGGKNPERYPFLTRDDLVTRLTAGFSYPGELSFGFRVTGNSYLMNAEKSYLSFGTWLKWRGGRLELKKIPHFLLRYYPDIDSPDSEYRACRFNMNLLKVSLEFPLYWIKATISGELSGLHYSPAFKEYDTKGKKGILGVSYKRKFFEATLKSSYERTIARAYDEEGETPEISDDPDISYKRWTILGEIKRRFESIPIELGVSLRWRYKKFVPRIEKRSEDYFDYYHRGRKDKDVRATLETTYKLNRRISLFVEGAYEKRWVKSPYEKLIFEIKDYKRKIISIGLRATL